MGSTVASRTASKATSYTITYGTSSDSATVTMETSGPPAGIVGDDFSDGVLGSGWTYAGPSGTGYTIATTATESFVALITPSGNFDLWGTNKGAARALQAVSDGDFEAELRFLSAPSERYQMQGTLAEQDASNDQIQLAGELPTTCCRRMERGCLPGRRSGRVVLWAARAS